MIARPSVRLVNLAGPELWPLASLQSRGRETRFRRPLRPAQPGVHRGFGSRPIPRCARDGRVGRRARSADGGAERAPRVRRRLPAERIDDGCRGRGADVAGHDPGGRGGRLAARSAASGRGRRGGRPGVGRAAADRGRRRLRAGRVRHVRRVAGRTGQAGRRDDHRAAPGVDRRTVRVPRPDGAGDPATAPARRASVVGGREHGRGGAAGGPPRRGLHAVGAGGLGALPRRAGGDGRGRPGPGLRGDVVVHVRGRRCRAGMGGDRSVCLARRGAVRTLGSRGRDRRVDGL